MFDYWRKLIYLSTHCHSTTYLHENLSKLEKLKVPLKKNQFNYIKLL